MTFEAQQQLAPLGMSSIVPSTPMEMLGRAVQMGANPDTLEKLLALQERWEAKESRKAFDEAMIQATAEFEPVVKKHRANYGTGKTNYEYEDLANIEDAVKPSLNKYGIFYRWRPKVEANLIIVTCILYGHGHRDEECSLPAAADKSGSKNEIQALGSTVTYLERYTLRAALGLAPTKGADKDGADIAATINDEQYKELQAEFTRTGANIDAFCQVFEIEGPRDLPAAQFTTAKNMLALRRSNQEPKS